MGWGALLSYRENGLVGKKPKSQKNQSRPQLEIVIILLVLPFADLHGFHSAQAFFHLMCPTKTLSLGTAERKLGITCVLSSIYHEQDARICMVQEAPPSSNSSLQMDLPPVSAFMVQKVTTLVHETWNNSVNGGTLISKSYCSNAHSKKSFQLFGTLSANRLKDIAQGLTINHNVEVHSREDFGYGKQTQGRQCLQQKSQLVLFIKMI